MLETLRERAKTLRELVEVGRFYFERPDAATRTRRARSSSRPRALGVSTLLIERLATLEPFTAPAIEGSIASSSPAMGLKLVDLAQLTRLAVTGRTASPPLFDVLALLGREEVLARLRDGAVRGPRGVRLLLARHGESVWNAERALPGPDRHPAVRPRPRPGRGAGPGPARAIACARPT